MAKIIISIREKLLGDVDKYCERYTYNRSELVRHALRGILNVNPKKVTTESKEENKR